jgi:hypothetical protein
MSSDEIDSRYSITSRQSYLRIPMPLKNHLNRVSPAIPSYMTSDKKIRDSKWYCLGIKLSDRTEVALPVEAHGS